MNLRSTTIAAVLSLMPIGQPLVFGGGAALTSTALLLSIPEKAKAESAEFYYNRGIQKGKSKDWYGGISDLTKAIELNSKDPAPYEGRGLMKGVLGDEKGACSDIKQALLLGSKTASKTFNKRCMKASIKSDDYEINDNQIKYKSNKSNIFTSGDSVEEHRTRLNNLLLGFWQFTPFADTNPIPIMLTSKNKDGTINISYCRGTRENPDRSKESYFYTINHDGMVSVKESNEVLNLNDIVHIFGIISTIIRDVYGDYDSRVVMEKYINSITSKNER